MVKLKFITKIFQSYIIDKDIRFFKKKFLYYIIFRFVKNFLIDDIILTIYNFRVFGSYKKNKTSYYLLKKCDFGDNHEINTIKKLSFNNKILFIDCGCNYGFYSLFVASISSKNIIYSIEASKNASKDFLKNLDLNQFSNVKFINKAVSNSDDDIISFNESLNDWESSYDQKNFKIKSVEQIKTLKIDSLINNIKLDNYISIIKLDIEGAEMKALEGSSNFIKKVSPLIIVEFSRFTFNNKIKVDFFKNFLKNFNYLIYDTSCKQLSLDEILIKLEKLKNKNNTIGNYYLINNSTNYFNFLEKNV